ncbi:hypothetical protein PGIGA_G00221330 [Pangasianodon gigas]|uniref:Uncharacterized protein n=1 Tax=Pangasianodon gigas TaxID=30993 RepID=A0ACC5WJ21_PANGG|nr:hypothetical protein [Pangasianodon gigas]
MRDPPSDAVGAAAAGAETPEKRCSNRAFLSALTRSAADRWLKAAQHLRLSPHGEENVPEILDREHFHQEGMCLHTASVQGPTQMPSRMSDLPAARQVLLRPAGPATRWIHSESGDEVLGCEAG